MWWVEAIYDVAHVYAKVDISFLPACDSLTQTPQARSVKAWHSIEREAIGNVSILNIADDTCHTEFVRQASLCFYNDVDAGFPRNFESVSK